MLKLILIALIVIIIFQSLIIRRLAWRVRVLENRLEERQVINITPRQKMKR